MVHSLLMRMYCVCSVPLHVACVRTHVSSISRYSRLPADERQSYSGTLWPGSGQLSRTGIHKDTRRNSNFLCRSTSWCLPGVATQFPARSQSCGTCQACLLSAIAGLARPVPDLICCAGLDKDLAKVPPAQLFSHALHWLGFPYCSFCHHHSVLPWSEWFDPVDFICWLLVCIRQWLCPPCLQAQILHH